MINCELLLRLFNGFMIQRWNEWIRPVTLNQMDENALTSILAFMIALQEDNKNPNIDWEGLVDKSVFSLLKKTSLPDIKAPVKRIIEESETECRLLNQKIIDDTIPLLPKNTAEKYANYIQNNSSDLSSKILTAAHKTSTFREFQVIKASNQFRPQLSSIEKDIYARIAQYMEFEGVRDMVTQQGIYEVICLIEQLRFQMRWGQTSRIPSTSVLGHSMLVACIAYFLSLEENVCSQQLVNNFYAGLFHDIPEVLVGDIVSTFKESTPEMSNVIKDIEVKLCNEELFAKMPLSIRERVRYLAGFIDCTHCNEFGSRIIDNGKPRFLAAEENIDHYNDKQFSPVNGPLVKLADKLAAYLEAIQALKCGVRTRVLVEGEKLLYADLNNCDNSQVKGIIKGLQNYLL